MSYVIGYSIPAAMAFVAAVILFIKSFRGGKRPIRFMALLLVMIAVCALMYAQYFNSSAAGKIIFDLIYTIVAPLCLPVFCLFIISLTSADGFSSRTWHIFIIPALYGLTVIAVSFFMTQADIDAYMCTVVTRDAPTGEITIAGKMMTWIAFHLFSAGLPIGVMLTLAWCESRLTNYQKVIDMYYATPEGKSISTAHMINIAILLIVPIGIYLTFVPMAFNTPPALVWTMLGLQCLLIFFIYKYTDSITFTASDLKDVIDEDNKFQGSMDTIGLVSNRLEELTAQQIYLDPDISLISLAKDLGTNRSYAVKAIADRYNCSFSDYVNQHRIRYATALMARTPRKEVSIKDIAEKSGYISLTSFHRNFELFTGKTPTEWLGRNR